jgi:hypothetical protein
MNDIEVLAAALRGEVPAGIPLSDALVDAAEGHGVAALLAGTAMAQSAAPGVASRLNAIVSGGAALAVVRDRELRRVLAALDAGGVSPILIKGAHLAHTIFSAPALRPREDTDLVIAEAERGTTTALLEQASYGRKVHVRGALILGQWHFQRVDELGVLHVLDVHWRLAAPLVVRRVLPVAVLRASRVPLPALGPHAWAPAPPHALAVACVHLVAHHRGAPVLLWFYEIARLAVRLDARETAMFLETAAAAGISAICAAALHMAQGYFPSAGLAALAALARAAGASTREPSAALLDVERPIDHLWLDVRAADGWRERMTLLREHLYPDAEYMRATSAKTGSLPLAYVRRAVHGAREWMAARPPSRS